MKHASKLISLLLVAAMVLLCGCHDSSLDTNIVQVDYDVKAAIAPYEKNLLPLTEEDKAYHIQMGYNDCDHMVTAIIGEKTGLYEALGMTVTVTKTGKTQDGLVSGEMDVGYAGLNGVLKAAAQGAPVIIPAGSHLGGSKYLVVRPDITKTEEMLGLRFAVTEKDQVSPQWRGHCVHLGIPFIVDYYEYAQMSQPDAMVALKADVIDAFICCDPYASIAEHEGFGKIVSTEWNAPFVSEDRETGWGIHCGYYINTDFAEAHPALAQRLVLAHCLGIQYMYLHPYNAGMMFADGFGVDPAVGLRTIYIKLCAEGRTIAYKMDQSNIDNFKAYYDYHCIAEEDRPEVEFFEDFLDLSIYNSLGMQPFDEFIKEQINDKYKLGTTYPEFLEIAETIDGIDHSSTVGKDVEKWMTSNEIEEILDQDSRIVEYDYSSGYINMVWNVDPATLGVEDLMDDYKAAGGR